MHDGNAPVALFEARSLGSEDQQAPGFCWQNAEPSPAPPLLEPEVVEPVPLVPDVPPPPVALVPPVVGPVGAPVEPVAPVAPLEPVDPPVADEEADEEELLEDGEELAAVVSVGVVVWVDVLAACVETEATEAFAELPGTVRLGVLAVLPAAVEEPPPQADTPAARARPQHNATRMVIGRLMRSRSR